jgi:hypothetical protein
MVPLRTVVRAATLRLTAREDIPLTARLAETTVRLGLRIARREVTAPREAIAHRAAIVRHEVRLAATVRRVAPVEALVLQAAVVTPVVEAIRAVAVTDAAKHRVSGFVDSNPDLILSSSNVSPRPRYFRGRGAFTHEIAHDFRGQDEHCRNY